jgi:phosphoenolpyruvate-protein kinase (PTS system EI component)
MKHLDYGSAAVLEQLPPGTVVVARELLPSDTLNLDRAHVVGLVLEGGRPRGRGHDAVPGGRHRP